jgi:hypothetical protein
MKSPVIVKFLSVLVNLIAYLLITIIIQNGDAFIMAIWTAPLTIVIGVSGGNATQLLITTNQLLKMILLFLIAFFFSLVWFYFIDFLWGGGSQGPFYVPIFYIWVAGSSVQLLFLDNFLPKQIDKIDPWKIIVRVIIVPAAIMALLYYLILIFAHYASS